jgi:hypothetical protein
MSSKSSSRGAFGRKKSSASTSTPSESSSSSISRLLGIGRRAASRVARREKAGRYGNSRDDVVARAWKNAYGQTVLKFIDGFHLGFEIHRSDRWISSLWVTFFSPALRRGESADESPSDANRRLARDETKRDDAKRDDATRRARNGDAVDARGRASKACVGGMPLAADAVDAFVRAPPNGRKSLSKVISR